MVEQGVLKLRNDVSRERILTDGVETHRDAVLVQAFEVNVTPIGERVAGALERIISENGPVHDRADASGHCGSRPSIGEKSEKRGTRERRGRAQIQSRLEEH